MSEEVKIEKALNWILDFVETESIPYMIMGDWLQ